MDARMSTDTKKVEEAPKLKNRKFLVHSVFRTTVYKNFFFEP